MSYIYVDMSNICVHMYMPKCQKYININMSYLFTSYICIFTTIYVHIIEIYLYVLMINNYVNPSEFWVHGPPN